MCKNKHHIKVLILVCFIIISCGKAQDPIEFYGIIPQPKEQKLGKGHFLFSGNTAIKYHPGLEKTVMYFNKLIEKGTGKSLEINPSKEKDFISFEIDTTISDIEGYRLTVSDQEILIRSKDSKGSFYAVQTLRQLFPPCFENNSCDTTIKLPVISIVDEPRFSYRGMHLDVGRHLFSVEEIKRYIEILSILKFNTFHWHLTEDQGWRIEIKKYPKLTEIGAYRKETLVGHYNDQPHQFDGKRYGGFYTQEEIKEVVTFAQERNITIIPEIEMPGHSKAAIAAYPELGCGGKSAEVATKWGVFEDVYCPTEKTFAFLQDVLDEVMMLFPSEYIHIGGDETPKAQWKASEYCQQLIQKEGLTDEFGLQSYFIKRIEKYLNSKGRKIIGWDEILEGGLAPNAVVMSWRGTEGAVSAVKENHKAILTPSSHCYFDYYQSDKEDEPLAIGGFLPLEKVYGFEPIPDELSQEEASLILGAQGNVWTEYMKTFDKVTYMALPRAIALSEVVWSPSEVKDYKSFVNRLIPFQKRLDVLGINYANHLYEIEGDLEIDDQHMRYSLKTLLQDTTIRYTLDGSEPINTSMKYDQPIFIDKSCTIKAQVFKDDKPLGTVFKQDLLKHKAVGATISIDKDPHPSYDAGGKKALINSIKGSSTRYGDKEWLGFWGEDLEVILDLKQILEISKIETRFYNANGQWIYLPKNVEVSLSKDNLTYSELISKVPQDNLSNKSTVPISINLDTSECRFIKMVVKNYEVIPAGLQGAGNKAWTFIDEIIVE
ncbi:beta-N-acetylhexosaminidase [Aquimarina litoralis]|uniref:beta-N-acetylhexosaminidase n=1 Tax=Aquimarina litoralis TaxID=584605 RepID=UPI001C55D7CC|nr:glycoside hydrolase family 20 protein [Aquimarina litoralis]MBW1297268.1 family 20 glycosylhydrolase [Aquimarina litoralis]